MAKKQPDEADRATLAYQVALTSIGAKTIADALTLWADVPATKQSKTATTWLNRALVLVLGRRRLSRDLAMAYYRLVRALRTGTTIEDPRHPDPPVVSIQMLRDQFAALAPPVKPLEGPPVKRGAPTTVPDTDEHDDEIDGNTVIPTEEIPGLADDQDRLEQSAADEAKIDLTALGPNNLQAKLKLIDTSKPADEVDAAREAAHKRAGTRQAAAAERVAIDAARGNIWNIAQKDKRVIGYVRLSRTGTPCGWCAMLISRGAVYKSEKSATYGDGDLYHDNCHCYAEPVYSKAQYAESSAYDLNREYKKLWPKVTRGLSGKAAVSAWRRFIRQQAGVQAAPEPTSVQEA